jgi:16S rRNA (cytosine967-C5)-methyltransferase
VRIVAADVMEWQPEAPADAILLDAPCSATGIFRRHPDVLYRARPRAIAALAEAQKAMLGRAADWLKPGGTLVYSVCSLEPEEGEKVLESFLQSRPDYRLDAVLKTELPVGLEPRADGTIRILPGVFDEVGGADAFFVARMKRID